jgi:hypothetical protein
MNVMIHNIPDQLLRLCRKTGMQIDDAHIVALNQAQIPFTLYARQLKPSWNVMANMAILSMSTQQL